MATWKHAERRIAKLLGGQRLGPTGTPQPDVVTDWLAIEVKHRAKLPEWLIAAAVQASANLKLLCSKAMDNPNADGIPSSERLPIVVLHEKGMLYKDSLVVLRLGDWVEWFGGGE